ncbi:uncharacterized protein LOC131679943 [Topomyia yanbarensis]|uniref:uncharacterized protein LOC131679943 n=1 Tax=Topomyia yanbarensis TaxID=2498891 RepID=UPI00273AE6C1|nr:uncharacterized protein LOC131679943 [Topomyia yanbarensis]
MLDQEIADQLDIKGHPNTLCLQWTGGVTKRIPDTRVINLNISGRGMEKQYAVKNVYTVENLDLPVQTVQFEKLAEQFPYLQGLSIKSFYRAVPRILIGLSNVNLLTSLKVREGPEGKPVATKSRLGWALYGTESEVYTSQLQHRSMHILARTQDEELHDLVKQFFSIESIGVTISPTVEGEEDKRARRILQETTKRTSSGKFETGLLWRHDNVEFPDSKLTAEKRLISLEKKLMKNPELYKNVRRQIHEYKVKGYAHEANDEELSQFDPRRMWYLPLGIALNHRKPEKVRVIWDAAAKVKGVSLNSMLLKGPDLLTSLTAVLFQFRQREVAITGDIREMFHQLYIRSQDRQSQLFLWRDNPNQPMKTLVMDVATFGSACSPCSAHFVKNLNAEEHAAVYPKATKAILENHYVDDFSDSFDTVEETIVQALDVQKIHKKAGFELRNWSSNSNEVLRRVGEPNTDTVRSFKFGKDSDIERVLGMVWLPMRDDFSFAIAFRPDLCPLIEGSAIPTKRQLLRVVMSVFDPLGLIAAITIHGKILIQDVWRAKIGWDDQIPNNLINRWQQWVDVLRTLEKVAVSRCYFLGYDPFSYLTLELHVFVDASEQAYAAVAYFRIIDRGDIRCSLVAAKAKVAPLQPLTIPRLELQAAVIGSFGAIPVPFSPGFSQTNAFRVNEVLNETNETEWRWISTRLNVADEATKWSKRPLLEQDSRWFQGPSVLYEENNHQSQEPLPPPDTSEELRPVYVHRYVVLQSLVDFRRFSKWERLLGALKYVHRFISLCKKGVNRDASIQRDAARDEFRLAERTAWKIAQYGGFQDEVITLRRNLELPRDKQKPLDKSSSIFKSSPELDEFGVLRMESRLKEAEFLSYDTRFPVVLPRGHYITNLILDWYHRQQGHRNGEIVVNEVRQKFAISRLRVEVRQTVKRCQYCRVFKATPKAPRMSALSESRVTPFVKPFTYTGVDYFGPCLIKIGRNDVKRWVALFTCLTIRAVHLEVVASLTTDSCKKAIRRFVARRGAPQEIFSDQGTGAKRELEREVDRINGCLASTFTDTTTQWHLNPPASPHMGGCWERMVRSVKEAMSCLSSARKLDEESFVTLVTEAEAMVNSRPLTYIPLDTFEQESLTPNHFLLLSSKGICQPVKAPIDEKVALRSSWNIVQHMLDQF